MPDVVRSPKNKRPAPWLIISILIVVIALTAVAVNPALRQNLNKSERVTNLILQLQGLDYRLTALEWQSVNMGRLASDIVERVQSTRKEMQGIVGELEQLDPGSESLKSIRQAFTAYDSAVIKEFELITIGDLKQARSMDVEQVDPTFKVLGQALASANAVYSAKAGQIKQTIDLGFTLLLFFIATATALVFWRAQSAQAAIGREHLGELKVINDELEANQKKLEQRVLERTAELERRAAQMETIASAARSITAAKNLEQLLPSICQVVSERFGFYHTGIFLLDERAEYAILQAANSPGGQQMLQRGHHLRVGAAGIVGTAAEQGKAHIALDVGADAVYFDNPDLPTTRSEMALPLKIGEQVIGILDVQSEQVGAFKEEDIAVLGILADQISVAIENARLFSQTHNTLLESQTIYQQYVKQDWARFAQTLKQHGYIYDGIKTSPLSENLSEPGTEGLSIPVKIRGLVVGYVVVRSANPLRQWTQDEINLAQAAADRAGLSIENVRLLTEAQRRAAKERTIGEITSRISSSVDMSAILQTAVEELGRALPGSDVVLQFREQKTPARPVDRPGRETQ